MSASSAAAVPGPAAVDTGFDESGTRRELSGLAAKIVAAVALAFSSYQLVIAAFAPLSSLPTRSLHVGFLLALAFSINAAGKWAARTRIPWYDAGLAVLAFAISTYHLIFEGARRVLGVALPLICGAFLAYGMFGQFLPSVLAHRAYGFDQIVSQLFLGTEGLFGIPTLVSATY
ncbi:MAG: TRAP transporter permease, partial [Casimicrobiaceae bacterium]